MGASRDPLVPLRDSRLEILGRAALQLAGFRPAYLRRALKRTVEALDAKETKLFSHEGKVTDKRVLVDHTVRLGAADTIFRMVPGVYAAKPSGPQPGSIVVEVITLAPDGGRSVVRIAANSDSEPKDED